MFSAGQIRDRAKLLSHEMRLAERVAQARPDLALPHEVFLAGPNFLTVDQLFAAPPQMTDGFTVPGQPLPPFNLPRLPLFSDHSPMGAPSALRDEVLDETPLDQLMSLPPADDVSPVVDPSLVDVSQPWGDAHNSTQMEPMLAAWKWLADIFPVLSELPVVPVLSVEDETEIVEPIPVVAALPEGPISVELEAPETPVEPEVLVEVIVPQVAEAAPASAAAPEPVVTESAAPAPHSAVQSPNGLTREEKFARMAEELDAHRGNRGAAAWFYARKYGVRGFDGRQLAAHIRQAVPHSPLWRYRVACPDIETPEGALDLVLELVERNCGQDLRNWVVENGYADLSGAVAKFKVERNKYGADKYYQEAPNPNLLFKRLDELRTALPRLLSGEEPAGELRGLISEILAAPEARALPQPLYQWLRSVDTGTNSSHGAAVDDGAFLDELADLLAK